MNAMKKFAFVLALVMLLSMIPSVAASPSPGLLISEVCYNPPNLTASDTYEYIEVVNVSDKDIDISGCYFTAAHDDEEAKRNDLVTYSSSPVLHPDQVAVFLIYQLSTSKEGVGYANAAETETLRQAFNTAFKSNVDADSFFVIPRANSGGSNMSTCFALSNTAEKTEIKMFSKDGAVIAQAIYSPAKNNRNGYSVGFSRTAEEPNRVFGLVAMTPGSFPQGLYKETVGDFTVPIKAMTYNICASGVKGDKVSVDKADEGIPDASLYIANRADKIISVIKEESPDLLTLNEVNGEWWKLLEPVLSEEYGYFGYTNQDHEISGSLTYKWDIAPVVLYKKTRFTEINKYRFFQSTDSRLIKAATNMAILQENETGAQLVFVSQHMTTESDALRQEAVDITMGMINSKGRNLPVIIMGDYNTYEGTGSYNKFLSYGLTDAAVMNPYISRTGSYTDWNPEGLRDVNIYLPIDIAMFSTGDFKVLSYKNRIDQLSSGYTYSDHIPLILELEMVNKVTDPFKLVKDAAVSIKNGYFFCEHDLTVADGMKSFLTPDAYETDCIQFMSTGKKITRKTDSSTALTVIARCDVSGDGKITSADYLMIKKSFNGSLTLNEVQTLAADCNSDTKITSADYLTIRKIFKGQA